jgi:basic membrane protein A
MRRNSPAHPRLVAAGALILSACGGEDEAAGFKACQITDTGGIDDRSFNQTVWDGFLRAEEELGAEVKYLESTSEADYDPNIQAFIDEGCDVIVTVGFLLGDATERSRSRTPTRRSASSTTPTRPPTTTCSAWCSTPTRPRSSPATPRQG